MKKSLETIFGLLLLSAVFAGCKKTQSYDDFVLLQRKNFHMGSKNGFTDTLPVHKVRILNDFYIQNHEVTQEEFESIMGYNPSFFASGDSISGEAKNRPVEQVSWNEAIVYCNKLSLKKGFRPCYSIKGKTNPDEWGQIPFVNDDSWNLIECDFKADGFRLPTEEEWEFAARAGNDNTSGPFYSGSRDGISECAWFMENSAALPHQVMTKKPNEFGLYDMSGNVWELTWDWYNYYSVRKNKRTPPYYRTIRGGGYYEPDFHCTVTYRDYVYPYGKDFDVGFRLVRTAR